MASMSPNACAPQARTGEGGAEIFPVPHAIRISVAPRTYGFWAAIVSNNHNEKNRKAKVSRNSEVERGLAATSRPSFRVPNPGFRLLYFPF